MKELKHTIDLENYIVNDLKTDEDIKLYLNTSLKNYIEDGDFNSFYRALELPSNQEIQFQVLQRKLECPELIYTVYLKMKKNLNFQPL